MNTIEIISPDDWHCHLREGAYLAETVANTARQFKRAIVMPNLISPVTDVQKAKAYVNEIAQCIPSGLRFQPLLTLYLTDKTTPHVIEEAKTSGLIYGCKLYPQNATTHSQAGVSNLQVIYPALQRMSELEIPLLIHGEVTSPLVDVFDREKEFIESHLKRLLKDFPQLKIVLEHITTEDAVHFVEQGSANLAATITPHHLLLNRNHLLVGGLKPHFYCLPILKKQEHQKALIKAATSGNPKFFLGTDSAPHVKSKKESACACAGIYHTAAMSMYVTIFEEANALAKLEGFASKFGPEFYGLPYNQDKLILEKKPWQIPNEIQFGKETVIPFHAQEEVLWQTLPN